MKKGIIFDMDGTLWDSAANVAESWNVAIAKFNEAELENGTSTIDRKITTEDMYNVMGKTMDVIAEILFPEVTGEKRAKLLELCCTVENDYLREHGGKLYPKIRETVEKLKENYHVYIVSNCQSGYIEAFLDYYDFNGLFEDIECFGNNNCVKADNIALMVKRNKLDDAVYVGDIQGDYDSSMKAGVKFIHAAYGFGTIDAKVPEISTFAELTQVVAQVI